MYSFSQNFEDVYIQRAFSDVVDGFYIDAGAFDPIVDSVTKMLYDLGWSGINLEPGPSFPTFSCRTRDINLPLALSGEEGKIIYYYNRDDPGASTTTISNKPTNSHASRTYEIISTTLKVVVQAHAPDRHIHFLKLDIEGAEWEVLKSTNWREIRPELIVVESSMPYSNVRRDDGWSDFMKSFEYEEVFFDGINTYYLREESLFRRGAFDFPVNVLDGVRKFEPYQHHILNDPERLALMNTISQEVARVVEAGNSSVREYLKHDVGQNVQVQKDLVAKLTSEQSEYFARLRAIADSFPISAQAPNGARGGNSADAIIREIANGVTSLVEDRERQAADIMRAHEVVEEQTEARKVQEELASRALGEAQLLAKRLNVSRASRITMLEMSERVTSARIDSIAAGSAEKVRAAEKIIASLSSEQLELKQSLKHGARIISEAGRLQDASDQELDRDLALVDEASPFAELMLNARKVPAWRRLFRFGDRALVRRADFFRDNGHWLDAAQSYAKAYSLRPGRADLCLQMANMLTELRAFPLAELAYREALTKAPGDGLILLHLGHMFEQSLRPLRARRAYLKSAQRIPDHPLIKELLQRVEKSIDGSSTE